MILSTDSLMVTLQVAACGMSLASMWFYGRKHLLGPVFGVLDFPPWAAVAWLTHTYYVLAFDVLITALAVRTLFLWRRDEVQADKRCRVPG
jgi:hypothetical protein